MEVVNGTQCDVQATQGLDNAGQPWLVVMAKATYRIEDRIEGRLAAPARPARQQNKLMATDLFEAEPGLSTPFFESDYVPFKAACDVIVKGSAHAPWRDGAPGAVRQLDVGLRVQGSDAEVVLQKTLRVYGQRQWRKRLGGWSLSEPEAFSVMPVTYGRAFGGMFTHEAIGSADPKDFLAHPMNLVGRGFAQGKFARLLDGAPAHQTELWVDGEPKLLTDPQQAHAPASLGPLARNWQPRLRWAGTYDQAWRDEVFPLLPADFDERFYQCAPEDQQMPYPKGGETVTLANLTLAAAKDAQNSQTRGLLRLKLPRRAMPMVVLDKQRNTHVLQPVMDTLAIDADAMRFDVTWRARMPLRRSLHEVHTVAVGSVSRRWWHGRVYGTGSEGGCEGCGDATTASDLAPVTEGLPT